MLPFCVPDKGDTNEISSNKSVSYPIVFGLWIDISGLCLFDGSNLVKQLFSSIVFLNPEYCNNFERVFCKDL